MTRSIRRYANRKLYDVKASRYVSLSDLLDLIRGGETIAVADVVSGDDITCLVLTQILLQGERTGRARLPAGLLHQMVQRAATAATAQGRGAQPRRYQRADKPAT